MAIDFIDLGDENSVSSLCDNIRYLLSLTITEEEVSNEIIFRDYYFGASSQEIELRLDFKEQADYDQLSDEQKRNIITALEYRITGKLLGDLPMFLSQEKLENSLRYNQWNIEEMKLVYLRLIEKELWEFRSLSFEPEAEIDPHLERTEPMIEKEEEAPSFVQLR